MDFKRFLWQAQFSTYFNLLLLFLVTIRTTFYVARFIQMIHLILFLMKETYHVKQKGTGGSLFWYRGLESYFLPHFATYFFIIIPISNLSSPVTFFLFLRSMNFSCWRCWFLSYDKGDTLSSSSLSALLW